MISSVRLRARWLIASICISASTMSQAAPISLDLQNGSFEIEFATGLAIPGWETIGSASEGCCFNPSTHPTNGRNAATLVANPSLGVSQGDLESFLALPIGKVSSLGQGRFQRGSAIAQTVAIHADRTLTFDFDFGIFPGNVSDYFFFAISQQLSPGVFFDSFVTVLATTSSGLSIPARDPCPPNTAPINCPSSNSFPETGFRSFALPIHETGIYRVGFGLVNADARQSAVIIDNVRLIPEPPTALLTTLCAGIFLGLTRKVHARTDLPPDCGPTCS